MEKKKDLHSGHRSRLKEKVRKAGLKNFAEHEIIELLLTYTIPRRDTNPLAHVLLNNFGSLSKVIDADYNDLIKINGVGKETALFFNILSAVNDEYRKSKSKTENTTIKATGDGVQYFRQRFEVADKEFMHVVCLSKAGKIVHSFEYNGFDDVEVKIGIKDFADQINKDNVASIMIFHTHPKGSVLPSKQDLSATQRFAGITSIHGIDLLDHIIFNETEHYSMASFGYIHAMKQNSSNFINSFETENKENKIQVSSNYKVNIWEQIDLGDVTIEDKIKGLDKKKTRRTKKSTI